MIDVYKDVFTYIKMYLLGYQHNNKTRQAMYVLHNTEARSRNLCSCGKAVSITYWSLCACLHVRACVCACMWVTGRVGVCMRIRAYSLANPACNAYAPYWHLWPLGLHYILRYYLINGAIFGKKSRNIKVCFYFLYNFCLKHFSF
jgi:hypothetical protein